MSFKIKRWAQYRTVDMDDFIPGIKSYQTPGGAGINTRGFAIPWGGMILVLAYESDDTPIWAVYDPETDALAAGPYTGDVTNWAYYSATHGWDRDYQIWGNRWVFCAPHMSGYYHGADAFYGWDSSFNFSKPDPLVGGRTNLWPSYAGPGTDGLDPNLLCYTSGGVLDPAVVRVTLGQATVVEYSGDDIYFDSISGSTVFGMKKLGDYYCWHNADSDDVSDLGLYTSVPKDTNWENYLAMGYWAQSWTSLDLTIRGLTPDPDGGVVSKNDYGGGDYWAYVSDPLIELAGLPWASNWRYRLAYDGGYELDEDDLDGLDHNVGPEGPQEIPPTYNQNLGWYIGLTDFTSPISFTVYALNPHQPAPRESSHWNSYQSPAGWVGEYAIRDDLLLAHVLPFPDLRDPSSAAMPPQFRADGFIVGSQELFKQVGNQIIYEKDIKIDLSAYPTGDPDWWWPGSDGDHLDEMMAIFAGGGPTIVGRMPDPQWGMLNPLGNDVAYGLGVPAEQLGSEETHILSESRRISGTNFATPLGGSVGNMRRQLRGFSDGRFAYFESGTRIGSPPAWNGVVGRIQGSAWTTLVNFEELDPPNLGCDHWTVWAVDCIPRCRALPLGGWLVGATLYFGAWDWGDWENTPGSRDLTFKYKDGTDTGNGWVPAKLGWIGPLEIDDHHPVYLSAYDEWTANRSLYGPDALLVYSNDGEFIECLNNSNLYPPNGREIMVVPGTVPRIIYRVYRYGTYSDCAEGWGQYHGSDLSDYEVQGPMYVCYELESNGQIQPGAGAFKGFVDMSLLRDYSDKGATWRWETCCPSIYENLYPKLAWAPPSGAYVRSGLGGRGITLLDPLGGKDHSGLRGPAGQSKGRS